MDLGYWMLCEVDPKVVGGYCVDLAEENAENQKRRGMES